MAENSQIKRMVSKMIKVVLSFDDGRKDNYRIAKEVLEPLGIPATFNITTGYIKRNIAEEDKPGPHEPMSLEELKELSSSGLFEIAGHGVTHNNDIQNLLNSVLELREMCDPNSDICGIASPHSQFDLKQFEEAKNLFIKNGIKYLRISNDYTKMNKVKVWLRRLNRVIHNGYLYYWVNQDSIMKNVDFLLYSIPVIRDNRLREVISLIKKIGNSNEDCICILMFHSILRKGEVYYDDLFSWDYEEFQKLCEYLIVSKSNNIHITNSKEIMAL